MAEITMENVEQVFRPTNLNEGQVAAVKLIEDRFVQMAKDVIAHVPRCAVRTVVLRRLLEQKMLCVDAIAKGGLI